MHSDLGSEADMQTALRILRENQSIDNSLKKAADCSARLNEMHPDQFMLVVDFALSFMNGRPALLFYNHATRRHNRQQGLLDKGKKRVREVEEGFESLSVKEDSHGRALSEAETSLRTLREKHMQLKRRSTDLEERLAEANTRAKTAESAREKAAADKEAALRKIRCTICYDRGLEKVTSCGHGFCRECHDTHFQISPGGGPDLGFLPCPMCRRIIFPSDSRSIYGMSQAAN